MTDGQDATIISFANLDKAAPLREALMGRGMPCRLVLGQKWLRERLKPACVPVLFYFGSKPPRAADMERVRQKVGDQAWRVVLDGPTPTDMPPSPLMPPRFLLWPDDSDTIVKWLAKPTAEEERFGPFAALGLIGRSPSFVNALGVARRFARCDAPVLIQGETGVGKELVARAIHKLSARGSKRFVPVNCGAIPEALVESELFGHARGAFTDAKQASEGLVAYADGGTLLLDELESLSRKGQVALLRFLQDRRFRPVGGSAERTASLRIIAASNANLSDLSQRGVYRRDLFFRLSVLALRLPPLRERRDDIAPLASHFLACIAERYDSAPKRTSPSFKQALEDYDWPGNARELENFIHRSFLLTEREEICISEVGLPGEDAAPAVDVVSEIKPYHEARAAAMKAFETAYLKKLMTFSSGNITHAAQMAGTERRSLGRMLKRNKLCANLRKRAESD